MPRNNPLKSKSNEELAALYVARMDSKSTTPTKIYSTSDLWDTLRERLGFDEAYSIVEEAKTTAKMCGD